MIVSLWPTRGRELDAKGAYISALPLLSVHGLVESAPTCRIWDVKEKYKSFKTIVVKSKDRGARTKLTKALYSHDGRTIAASGIDGTIHLWSANSNFARPNAVRGAPSCPLMRIDRWKGPGLIGMMLFQSVTPDR